MMKIAIAQFNSILGDFSYNRKKIIEYINQAQKDRRCSLVVFPEACLFGYHPVDLLERNSIVQQQLKELKKIEDQIPEGIKALVGVITENNSKKGKPYHNSAVLIERGKKSKIFAKELLPTYDVFDETRHIEPGQISKNTFMLGKKRVLVTVCEDIWGWKLEGEERSHYKENPLHKVQKKIDLIVNLSASPFNDLKCEQRKFVTKKTAKKFKAPLIYVNMVGAQDELIFDGHSFAIDSKGSFLTQSKKFQEDLVLVDVFSKKNKNLMSSKKIRAIDHKREAIVLGIRDFVNKLNFSKVHLGLSGGVDSALVACLAVEALGPEAVTGIGLPGPFNSEKSLMWAKEQAQKMGCNWRMANINNLYNVGVKTLERSFGDFNFGLVNENLQSRLRGLLLMAFSNKEGSLLLNTSNKSELAMGYSTLYGDLIGGLSPIGDLLKHEVYELSKWYNKEKGWIPEGVIERPPSAELKPNQKDEDSLPPYKKLDSAVKKLVENTQATTGGLEKKVLHQMMKNEFKRWQAPPILKVSSHAFGRGRRLPVAHRAYF